jgi:gluconolactonase
MNLSTTETSATRGKLEMAEVRIVASGFGFPEGPVVMPDGAVILTEIAGKCVTRIGADGARSTVGSAGGGPNGLAIGPDGALYVCNNGGGKYPRDHWMAVGPADDYDGGCIQRIDPKTGDTRVLYTHCGANKLSAPNDLVFDTHGGFYFTDLGKGRHRDLDRGAVCYARADGSLIREVAFPMITPNGVGLSPDGGTLYVAETEPARLWAFDLDGPGEIRRQPWPSPHGGRLVTGSRNFQRFDSLAVDRAGNICVATLVHGGVSIVSPDGASVRHVPMPERWVTNICFGGPDLRTAYITLSSTGRLVACEWEEAGTPLAYLNG